MEFGVALYFFFKKYFFFLNDSIIFLFFLQEYGTIFLFFKKTELFWHVQPHVAKFSLFWHVQTHFSREKKGRNLKFCFRAQVLVSTTMRCKKVNYHVCFFIPQVNIHL